MSDDEFVVSRVNPPSVGGQQVGTPYCHIKVEHIATGIYAVCMSDRSQHRNRNIAKAMVEYGLAEIGYK